MAAQRYPFMGTVVASTCECGLPPRELFKTKDLEKGCKIIGGYWSVYLTFFGEQMIWLHFQIVDLRDGTVLWRDGALTKEGKEYGAIDPWEAGSGRGDAGNVGRWLVSGRPVAQRGSGGTPGAGG